MALSQSASSDLKLKEGLRLSAYKDSGGLWTIGWGHTKGVKPGMKITQPEAERLFKLDVEEAEAAVDRAIKVPLSQSERDALIIFAFNTGRVGETMAAKLNEGDREGAALEFRRWVYVTDPMTRAKVKVDGLVKRRAFEETMFRRAA